MEGWRSDSPADGVNSTLYRRVAHFSFHPPDSNPLDELKSTPTSLASAGGGAFFLSFNLSFISAAFDQPELPLSAIVVPPTTTGGGANPSRTNGWICPPSRWGGK